MRRLTPICLFILLALSQLGCAEDFPAGTTEQRGVGEVSFDSGVALGLQPGAANINGETSVTMRAAAPEPTLSISTLGSDAPMLAVEIQNVPTQAELQVTNIVERNSTASPDCPDETAGQVRCEETNDPRCTAPTATRPADDPETIRFEWTQPKCLQTNFRIALPAAERETQLRVGVVGKTSDADNTREALDAFDGRDIDYAVLLGDNAAGRKLSQLQKLSALVAEYDFPVYVLPGEAETTPTSRANFRAVFGPYDFNYRFKGTRFLVLYSAGGIVGSRRIFQLRNTLLRFAPDAPIVVLTHTPPIDPLGARNDGFLSELEAARTLSIMSDFGADLLLTGHINDAHEVDVRGIDMRVTSAAEHGRQVLLLTSPSEPAGPDDLSVEAISLD
ncbi:MAG: metallophosphoesterase family protein [Myxococcota bacterium]